jgi:hypothetical protein
MPLPNRNKPKTGFSPKSRFHHTNDIRFIGGGVDEDDNRFELIQVGENVVEVNMAALAKTPKDEIVRLQQSGIFLVEPAAQREFLTRAQQAAMKSATLRIVTRVGWTGDAFVFPDLVVGPEEGLYVALDSRATQIHQRFERLGDHPGFLQLMDLCRGNSRLVCTLALAFVGPCRILEPFEHVGLQLCGREEQGKSTIGIVGSSIYGFDPNRDHLQGFGDSWNATRNGLEPLAVAYNNTLLSLDETKNAPPDGRGACANVLNAITVLAEGRGKTRLGERSVSWFVPLLSTSNRSVIAMLREARMPPDFAYVGRLLDIPALEGVEAFFENLHGAPDVGAFCARLRHLARKNHGQAGFQFVKKLEPRIQEDRFGTRRTFLGYRAEYLRLARELTDRSRPLIRTHGKFATIFAAGCLAIDLGILPFDKQELLAAVFACERDHVAFIAREVQQHYGVSPASASTPATTPAARSPFDRLLAFLFGPARSRFIRVDHLDGSTAPAPQTILVGECKGRREFWLPSTKFESIAGSAADTKTLRVKLEKFGAIATTGQGKEKRFVVKRPIPGRPRTWVVALAEKPLEGIVRKRAAPPNRVS